MTTVGVLALMKQSSGAVADEQFSRRLLAEYLANCQSALKNDPQSASKIDPPPGGVLKADAGGRWNERAVA